MNALKKASQQALYITAMAADTIVKPYIPVDRGVKIIDSKGNLRGLRVATITKLTDGRVKLEHGAGVKYRKFQYYGYLNHIFSGNEYQSIVSRFGASTTFKKGAGAIAIYGSAYRQAMKAGALSKSTAQWYKILKDKNVKRQLSAVFTNALKQMI